MIISNASSLMKNLTPVLCILKNTFQQSVHLDPEIKVIKEFRLVFFSIIVGNDSFLLLALCKNMRLLNMDKIGSPIFETVWRKSLSVWKVCEKSSNGSW